MSLYKITPLVLIPFLLSACVSKPPDNQLLIFLETETGIQPYQVRVIVTPTQMRFDDGNDSKSYTLFDRVNQIARTVDTEQRTILEMHPKSVEVEPPFALNYHIKDLGDMKDAPMIMGKHPRHYQDYTNDKLCYDVVSVKGMLPGAVKALSEFQQLLASDSKETVNNMPADMLDPCSIAMDTFAPTRFLQHGFPVHQWRPGFSKMLVDYKDHYMPDPKLFELPSGYFSYTVQQIRDGLVDLENRKLREVPPAQKTQGSTN